MPPIRLTLHLSWLTVFFGQADDIASPEILGIDQSMPIVAEAEQTADRRNIHRMARRSDLPVSGRRKFQVDPCQTARSVEHVMAVSG
jgi:hypothetical protein